MLAWGYQRKLRRHGRAERHLLRRRPRPPRRTVRDADLGAFSLPISGDDKQEVGANLWVYLGGFSFFGQYVDQEIAGMDRTGYEGEVAWRFDLPLAWAVAGRQLFPSIQPAVRYSLPRSPNSPGRRRSIRRPSVRWEWTKLDYGLRLGIIQGVDLTIEFADNEMTLANGAKISNDELLSTLRWRM